MWGRPFLIAFFSALTALPALAFERPFPEDTLRGTMSPGTFPEIVINGQLRHLAPGARIWNQDNLIQLPASLRGSDMTVNYTENPQGEIDRVWILNAEEAGQPPVRQLNSQSR